MQPRLIVTATQEGLRKLASWLHVPEGAQFVEQHRRAIFHRTGVAVVLASVSIPCILIGYAFQLQPALFRPLVLLAIGSNLLLGLILTARRATFFQRHYHLPFFLVVTVCNVTEALALRLIGPASASDFFFPYFLILFGVVTLFPSPWRWALTATAMSPVTMLVMQTLNPSQRVNWSDWTQLGLLVDYTVVAFISNRIATRLFFSELSTRLALESANAKLRELDRAKSDFIANVSHDLKTPLTVILGPLRVLQTKLTGLDARQHRYFELAINGANRLDAMINDLLELARINSGLGRLNQSKTNLTSLVGTLVEGTTAYAASVGLRLCADLPLRPIYAEVDLDKFERVLMNLISNAFKFSEPRTTVWVRLSADETGITLSVQDQGFGIAPEDLGRIFERFQRGDQELTRGVRGTGLGLSVVKEFVELHEGQVAVNSLLGEGSTFTVKLPASRLVLDAQTVPRRSSPTLRAISGLPSPNGLGTVAVRAGPAHGPRLLTVEDDGATREFIAGELSDTFNVQCAQRGADALVFAQSERPDIIMLDLMLPDGDAIELCRKLRLLPGFDQIPILVYSAETTIEARLKVFEATADDFMTKPLDVRELRARLLSLLRRSHVYSQRIAVAS